MRTRAHYNNTIVGSLLRLGNSDLLSFCSSVQKKEILPTLRSVRMTLCA